MSNRRAKKRRMNAQTVRRSSDSAAMVSWGCSLPVRRPRASRRMANSGNKTRRSSHLTLIGFSPPGDSAKPTPDVPRDESGGSPTGLAVQHCAAADIVSATAKLPVALVMLRFARRLAQRLAVTVVAGIYAAVRHCPRLCDDGGPI